MLHAIPPGSKNILKLRQICGSENIALDQQRAHHEDTAISPSGVDSFRVSKDFALGCWCLGQHDGSRHLAPLMDQTFEVS